LKVIFGALICLVLCCSVSGSPHGDGFLDGDVADTFEQAPVPKAFVYIHSRVANDKVAELTPSARFHVALAPGIYDVFVAAKGFAPMCKAITIQEGRTTNFKAKIGPDIENSQN
jgi:hypothetical protein